MGVVVVSVSVSVGLEPIGVVKRCQCLRNATIILTALAGGGSVPLDRRLHMRKKTTSPAPSTQLTQAIFVRVDKATVAKIDKKLVATRAQRPGAVLSRSDIVRELLAQALERG